MLYPYSYSLPMVKLENGTTFYINPLTIDNLQERYLNKHPRPPVFFRRPFLNEDLSNASIAGKAVCSVFNKWI